jgi:cystathionine gamma-synthase
VDETIGTFANINVLPLADMVVSSLTKIFSGDCNVMGGSAVVNPRGRYYAQLQAAMRRQYQDTYWAEDAIFMERNSRDFSGRIGRINANAEAICDELASSPLVRRVYYPKVNESRPNYEQCKLPTGGYGGLLSAVFHEKATAVVFYDALQTAKGPSLGTNFTLASPYVVLAHYNELDWAAGLGVAPDLIRISVGLEETRHLVRVFSEALEVAANSCATTSPQ